MQANGYVMPWEEFKSKFNKAHVPMGLVKRMRDEFRNLKQGSLSVVDYRDKFLTLSRYAPDDADTNEKKQERFLNGLHDEMQCVLVSIPFVDLESLVDSAIQMEGKLKQALENRKRRMMYQGNSSNSQKPRVNQSPGFAPRPNRAPAPAPRPSYPNRSGGNNFNRAPPNSGGNNFNSTTPRPSGAPSLPKPGDKSGVTCYGCGLKGHYSNECLKKMNEAPKPAAPAQHQCHDGNGKNYAPRNPPNPRGRLNHMNVEEAQEATSVVLGMFLVNSVLARVLFDSGASHSFVTESFVDKSGLQQTPLKNIMSVQIPGSITKARWTCLAVPIEIHGIGFLASLIVLGTKGLEVVFGMDWMSQHQGVIDCAKKTITMTSSTGIVVKHVSVKPPSNHPMPQDYLWTHSGSSSHSL
jgi:hypothetical protein